MLIEFSVENYKSFRERATLSMLASNLVSEDKKVDEDNVFEAAPGLRLLRSAAIYGANASGKSNLASAFGFMRDFVMNSVKGTRQVEGITVEPYLLNTKSSLEPSRFEVVIELNGTQYRYGFDVTKREVVAEWLLASKSSRESTLFTREGDNIKCGRLFKEGYGLETRTRRNALFISVVAQFNGEIATYIVNWFNFSLTTVGLYDAAFREWTLEWLDRDEDLLESLFDFVGSLDLGLTSLQVERVDDYYDDEYDFLSEPPQTMFKAFHNVRNESGDIVKAIPFDVDQHESQGTRKLLAFALPIQHALTVGRLIFIDEFDARLHPIISRAIISMFNDPAINTGNGQLIAITHDTNLLDKSLFRRDQIWFVEKDHHDESHLTSLAEFRVKNDAAYEKNYLQGRYSAIPYLGDLTALPKVPDAVA